MYPYFSGYGLYILFSFPALLLGFWARMKVQNAINRFSKVRTISGLSGAVVARRMLDNNGLNDVKIEQTHGFLSDHYDPRSKTLRLSSKVFQGNSIVSSGIAAHEAGHAIQDSNDYLPLRFRSAMVPTVQFGSWFGPILFIIGLLLSTDFGYQISSAGIILFALTALFAIITLPVEFDASKRAKSWLISSGLIYRDEINGVNKVLDAAALTYVAGAIQAISTLLYYAFILLGRRRD